MLVMQREGLDLDGLDAGVEVERQQPVTLQRRLESGDASVAQSHAPGQASSACPELTYRGVRTQSRH
jgi:hypothetical protein